MALPATDDFTTGSDQDLDDYSANWTINSGDFRVLAANDDVYHSVSSYDRAAHWNADSFADNQYAQVTVTAISAGRYIGPSVRCAAAADTHYDYAVSSGDRYLIKVVAGSNSVLAGPTTGGASVSDILRIEVRGDQITPIRNGSIDEELGVQIDSAISSGYAGISGGNNGTTRGSALDNWEGGNLSLPATDNFTTSSDQDLETYSSNWTYNNGTFTVYDTGDDVSGASSATENGAHWNADSFNNNQYSEAVCSKDDYGGTPSLGSAQGVAVRANLSGTANFYGFYADGDGATTTKSFLFKVKAGVWEQIGSDGTAGMTVNDVIRLEIDGTTLTPKLNGSTTGTPGAQIDSDFSSGASGLVGWHNRDLVRIDDWEGGNLVEGLSIPVAMHHYRKLRT